MSKKINTKSLVTKIEKMTKSRMASQPVVNLSDFRDSKKKSGPKTLLIIEDDESMRAALQRIFRADGYLLKIAADATELAKVLDDSPVDLILLDVGLPWINGIELAQLLKEHQDLKDLPLVFVSGSASEEEVKHAFSIGADDFIRKPFDVDHLRKSIATLLEMND